MSNASMNLPNEVLLLIILELQPNFKQLSDNLFSESPNSTSQTFVNTRTQQQITIDNDVNHKYHPTIKLQKGKPFLLILGQISRQFRQVTQMHPFYLTMQLYKLYPIPRTQVNSMNKILKLSQFIHQINERIQPKQITKIIIDPIISKQFMLPQDVIQILSKFNSLKLKELILNLGWFCLGDPLILNKLQEFKNLEKLYLKGKYEPGVLHGFPNQTIRVLCKNIRKLKFLYIEGFGGGSFSFRSYQTFLRLNTNLEVLTIGFVRGVVDLELVSSACPNLIQLTIQFNCQYPSNIPYDDNVEEVYFQSFLRSSRILVPSLSGGLSAFKKLKRVAFYDSSDSNDLSKPIVHSILNTIGHRIKYDVMLYENGEMIEFI
jgi:hypothetical protein